MSAIKQKQFYTELLKFLGVFFISAITFMGVGYANTSAVGRGAAIITGSLKLQPERLISTDEPSKIQPGTAVKLLLEIKNSGHAPSPAGEIYVRFAFAKPLDTRPNSVIFKTEKVALPSLAPGETKEISFTATHLIPSVTDFIRNDWPMREYEAIYIADNTEHVMAILPLTYSVYYYPAFHQSMSVELQGTEK